MSEKILEALRDVVDEYDWCTQDIYERGLSTLDVAINDARKTLSMMPCPDDREAEIARLRGILANLCDVLVCKGDIPHYCPNCDNSTEGALEIVRAALTTKT